MFRQGVRQVKRLGIAALAIFAGLPLGAQSSGLVGLPPIVVVIEADTIGRLDTTVLRTAVELKLRQNRIPLWKTGGIPVSFLTLTVNTARNSSVREYIFHLDLRAEQPARLLNSRREYFPLATVWRGRDAIGYAGMDLDLNDQVQKWVDQAVDAFLNDYLAANPPAS